MSKKQLTTVLIAILIIASFLRIYNLMPMGNYEPFSPPGLYPDEAMNGNNATEALAQNDWKVFYPENFGREGLFINIQSVFIRFLGNTPWALRLPSALFGILTVLGLYFFARELFTNYEFGLPGQGIRNNGEDPEIQNSLFIIRDSERIALFSAFLLATGYWHVHFSRIGFRAIMAPAFLTWGIYFFLKTIKNNYQFLISNYQRKWKLEIRNWVLPAIGGLIYGLGFYSYIAYRATPLLMLAVAYFIYRNFRAVNRAFPYREFLIFTAVAILTALPMGIYFLQNPADFFGRTTGISIFSAQSGSALGGNSFLVLKSLAINILKTLGMFNIVGDFNWRHNLAGSPQLSIPVGIFFLYGIWLAFKKISRGKLAAVPELILLSWFAIVMLPVIISNEGLPHALRAILMIPPVFILAASGGIAVYDFLKAHLNPQVLKTAAGIFLLMLLIEVYVSYFIIWSNRIEVRDSFSYRDYIIGDQISTLNTQLKKYVVVSDAGGTIRRDYPISLQTILFLSDTFTDEKRAEKNIFYLTPEEFKNLPENHGGVVIKF